jgi:putative FmdB family regulatory protein
MVADGQGSSATILSEKCWRLFAKISAGKERIMPIYEYTCPSCRKVFEQWVKEHDTTPQPCPDCGAISPHIVSNTTFVLKGGGWYVTEYGNRKKEEAPAASPGAEKTTPAASPSASPDAAAPSAGAGSASTAPPVPAAPAAKDAAASAA